MNGGDACALQCFFERQIEIGRIDADEERWSLLQHAVSQPAPNAENFTKAFKHFNVAAHGELFHRIPRRCARRLHSRPGDTDKFQIRIIFL